MCKFGRVLIQFFFLYCLYKYFWIYLRFLIDFLLGKERLRRLEVVFFLLLLFYVRVKYFIRECLKVVRNNFYSSICMLIMHYDI